MNKIIFTAAAALVVSAGAAFAAGGDHFPAYQPSAAVAVDQGATASIADRQIDGLSNSNVQVQDSDRGVWGR